MKKEKKVTKASIKRLQKRENNKNVKLWKTAVKDRDKHACVICGSAKLVNAHHIIPYQILEFRCDIDNGICLCPKHHKFSFKFSAHKNSFAFLIWFCYNRIEQYNRLFDKWVKYYTINREELKKC